MAAFDPSQFTDTNSSFVTACTSDESIVSSFTLNGTTYRIKAKTVTVKVEFRGLTRADAITMSKNNDYNYNNLHGVKYTSGGSFMAAPDCEGQVCKAEAQRTNDADFFRVVVTHVKTTTSHTGNWTKSTF